jgi:hypothetical protein
MALPKKGVAYEFFLSLVDALDAESFLADPTIAAGDFQISKDGGAFANLATLPVVEPSGSIGVKISLSAGEMDADKVMVQGIDQAGNEWFDVMVFIDVPTTNAETAGDLLEGDHFETSQKVQIFKKGTAIVLLDKNVGGSLLSPNVTITTNEP